MICQIYFVVMWLLISPYASNDNDDNSAIRILILGETGQGKSTLIKRTFKVTDYVPIGTGWDSETNNTNSYHIGNHILIDTPGFYDVGNGLTNEQILELIDVELQSISTKYTSINAILLIVTTHKMKEMANNHLTGYISLFGETMLESLVVVINHYEGDSDESAWNLRGYITSTLQHMVERSNNYDLSELSIPTVIINCKNPNKKELNNLNNAMNKVNPYKIKDLEHHKQEIEKIKQKILLNPENYKEKIEYMIKNETMKVTEQVLKRISKSVPVRNCGKVGGNFAGIYSWEDWKCVDGLEMGEEDIIVDLTKEQPVQFTEEIKTRVLKNEEHVYELLAKKMYKEDLIHRFKAANKKNKQKERKNDKQEL